MNWIGDMCIFLEGHTLLAVSENILLSVELDAGRIGVQKEAMGFLGSDEVYLDRLRKNLEHSTLYCGDDKVTLDIQHPLLHGVYVCERIVMERCEVPAAVVGLLWKQVVSSRPVVAAVLVPDAPTGSAAEPSAIMKEAIQAKPLRRIEPWLAIPKSKPISRFAKMPKAL